MKIKGNKIELICYCGDDISYQCKRGEDYILSSSIKLIPYDLKFTKDEMKKLLDILLSNNPRLKVTIEKEGKDEE